MISSLWLLATYGALGLLLMRSSALDFARTEARADAASGAKTQADALSVGS